MSSSKIFKNMLNMSHLTIHIVDVFICMVLKMRLTDPASILSRATVGPPAKHHPTVARFYVLTGDLLLQIYSDQVYKDGQRIE